MDSGIVALVILAVLVVGAGYGVLRLIRWLNKRYYHNMFRGNLRGDYVRNNPDLVRADQVVCRCGGDKIVLRNLGPIRLEGADVVREHVCHRCGSRLYFSASGAYLEGIIKELTTGAGFEKKCCKRTCV